VLTGYGEMMISVYTFLYLQGTSDSTSNVADKHYTPLSYKECAASGNPKNMKIKYAAITTLNVPHLLQ
jgi:hypothetical protein